MPFSRSSASSSRSRMRHSSSATLKPLPKPYCSMSCIRSRTQMCFQMSGSIQSTVSTTTVRKSCFSCRSSRAASSTSLKFCGVGKRAAST
jgi:hypothetical protein